MINPSTSELCLTCGHVVGVRVVRKVDVTMSYCVQCGDLLDMTFDDDEQEFHWPDDESEDDE